MGVLVGTRLKEAILTSTIIYVWGKNKENIINYQLKYVISFSMTTFLAILSIWGSASVMSM